MREVLPNGLHVVIREVRSIPIVCTMTWYRVGSRDEEVGRTGRSHLVEHMLFKGTDRFGKGEIDRLTVIEGGRTSAFTTHDATAYYFTFASDRWRVALEIEASRMADTIFDPSEFQRERAVVLEELRASEEQPWSLLADEAEETLFRVHPYRNPVGGRIEDVCAATVEEVASFYRTFYRPDNATLVLVGDLDARSSLGLVRQLFDPLERAAAPIRRPAAPAEPRLRGMRRSHLERETSTARLALAALAPPRGHPDESALRLAAAILADGSRSRLHRSMVEGRRLATEVSEDYTPRLDPTPVFLYVEAADGADLEAVHRAVSREIQRLAEGGPERAEMLRARRRLEARHLQHREAPLGEAEVLGETLALHPEGVPGDLVEDLEGVEAADIKRVVREWLAPDQRVVVTLEAPRRRRGHFREAGAGARPPHEPILHGHAPDPPSRTAPVAIVLRPAELHLPIERRLLDSGGVVLVASLPGPPTFSVVVELAAGVRDEDESQAGVAKLASMLLTQGTRRRSAAEIADAVESRGGHLDVEVNHERTQLRYEGLGDDLQFALTLLGDLVAECSFPAPRVERQKDLLLSLIRSERDDAAVLASQQLAEIVYRGHPRHRPSHGYARTVKSLGRADVVRFAGRCYAPAHLLVAVASGWPAREVMALADRAFGRWRRDAQPRPPRAEPTLRPPPSPSRVRAGNEQSHVLLGHLGIRRNDPEFVPAQVLDVILGAAPGFVSRIPKRIREDLGLAYTTVAHLSLTADLDPGCFMAYAVTAPENEDRVLRVLRDEIRSFRDAGPTDREVEEAKAHRTGSHVFDVEANTPRCERLLQLERYGLGLDYLGRYPTEVAAVTAEDVRRLARRALHPDLLATVIVGPSAVQRRGPSTGNRAVPR